MFLNRSHFVVLLLVSFCVLGPTDVTASERIEDLGLDLSLGYRVDQLDWSVAGGSAGGSPNILSELTWRDIEVVQLQLTGNLELKASPWLKANTVFQGRLAYGSIVSGSNQDSDYATDNRTLEWSRSENSADEGFTFDVSGAVGAKFNKVVNYFSITPLAGYSLHRQDLSITDGYQAFSNDVIHDTYFPTATGHPPKLGPIPGLDSSYTAYWYGPWVGLTIAAEPLEQLKIALTGEYHWIDYFAEANWNLREDLAHPISFEQEARGTGIVWSLETEYVLTDRWSMLLSGNLQYWQTDAGADTSYRADGTRGGTRLNEVSWDSYALMGGLLYRF